MRTWILLITTIIACGDNGLPPPRLEKPSAPDANDPSFAVQGIHQWYLIGNAATPGDDSMRIVVSPQIPVDVVDAWVGDLPPVRLERQASGQLVAEISIANVPAGADAVLLAADGSDAAFARIPFHRSAPYYVLVSTDYDFSDPGATSIMDMEAMHANHPEIRITHFWAPYTYTDPAVSAARRDELTAWIAKQRDVSHDEIGLHIHPYCNFVVDAGLTCITDQSTVYAEDVTGYTIKVGAYGRTDFGILLDHAADLFEARGLGRPTTFRAGGWTATIDTLNALADKGYIADTSALNWARIEEWKGKELYDWTMANWAPIGDTSQPWWPNATQILGSETPTLPVLEVPDNGVMIDYVSLAEMTGIFDANWSGTPIASPITLMMGFHPAAQFSRDEYFRVDGFLAYADMHLATRDLGPVVYTTLGDVTAAFPAPH